MTKLFYTRLALTNLRKNKSIYVPYLLVGTLLSTLFYCLRSVRHMLLASGAAGSSSMGMILDMSAWICGVFSMVILLYINSFIMKRRKKEFGIYSILGMEKRHIARVMTMEILLTGVFCVVAGIVCGALFSQLMFLLLLRLADLPVLMTFQLPLQAAVLTAVLYGGGFLLLLLGDLFSLGRLNPMALLRSESEGEREPKTKWLIAMLGVLTLGAGYFLSATVVTPADAVSVFFPAVALVVIGTYGLFLSGSIALLKLLRKNKRFYYKPKNFIAVSGMLYRMKQNATGLANICILSTCVLVTLSSTVSLMLGQEESLRTRYPRAVVTDCIVKGADDGPALVAANQAHARKYGVQIVNAEGFASLVFPAQRSGRQFAAAQIYGDEAYTVRAITLPDYNQLTGAQQRLSPGEVLVSVEEGPPVGAALALDGGSFAVREEIVRPAFLGDFLLGAELLVVLPSYDALQALAKTVDAITRVTYTDGTVSGARNLMYSYRYDVAGGNVDLTEFYATMRADLLETVDRLSEVSSRAQIRSEFYQLYGTLLFVGIFCVVLFLIAAVLIIYYKQITEGYDDHARFRILQNVGMSEQEVRATINKQVLLVFFLPLGMAALHIFVAFPVLCKLLRGLNMYNTGLFALCTVAAAVLFGLFYLLVYHRTSKIYYQIVQEK